MIIDDEAVLEGFRKRYSNVHPLLLRRSIEKALTLGELFDIMEKIPQELPLTWSEKNGCWIHSKDLELSESFDLKILES